MPRKESIVAPFTVRGLSPTPALRARLIEMHGKNTVHRFDKLLDDTIAIQAFGRLIFEMIEKHSEGGKKPINLNLCTDIGNDILTVMKENPK